MKLSRSTVIRARTLRAESLEDRRLMALSAELVTTHSGAGTLTEFTDVEGTLFYRREIGFGSWELWKSDGSETGTSRVKSFSAIAAGSSFHHLTNVNGIVYFATDDGTSGWELWKSDGTEAGTVRVKDIYPGAAGSFPGRLRALDGTLYFSANDGIHGDELWKSDGTEAGTVLVKDIRPGLAGSNTYANVIPVVLTDSNGTIYFFANDGVTGRSLWRSNGTDAGTSLVKDFSIHAYDGRYYGQLAGLTSAGGQLFFSVFDEFATNGIVELWKSDGTPTGTMLVRGFEHDTERSLGYFTDVAGTLFFTAYPNSSGRLWKSDGTTLGTVPVVHCQCPVDMSEFTNVHGTLFFRAFDYPYGIELWKSDGTDAGTTIVKDINPAVGYDSYPYSSYPQQLTSAGQRLFFVADDGAQGYKLWTTDGSEAGTELVGGEIYGSGSGVGNLTDISGSLYFTNDLELWKVVVEEEATPGDTNADGAVNIEDLNNVRNHFGETGDGVLGDTAPFDGKVDIQDLNAVRNNFGTVRGGGSALRAGRSDVDTGAIEHGFEPNAASREVSPSQAIAAQAADVLFGLHSNDASLKPPWKTHSRRQLVR